jgi:hypothetical protein
VKHAACRREKNQLMEATPPSSTEPPHHAGGRREGEGHEQEPRREPCGHPGMLADVLRNLRGGQRLIEDEVGEEMQRGEEEGQEPRQPARPNQLVPAGEPPDRTDRERDEQA